MTLTRRLWAKSSGPKPPTFTSFRPYLCVRPASLRPLGWSRNLRARIAPVFADSEQRRWGENKGSGADSVYLTCRLSSEQWLLEKSVSRCFVASFARRADDLGRPRIRFEKPGHYSRDERAQHEPQQPEHAHATKQTDEHQ